MGVFISFATYSLILFKYNIISSYFKFFKVFILLHILLVIFYFHFIFSLKDYTLFVNAIEFILTITNFFFLYLFIKNKAEFKSFTKYFLWTAFIAGVIIMVNYSNYAYMINKYYGPFYTFKYFYEMVPEWYINLDYNFAIIPLFFILFILFFVKKEWFKKYKFLIIFLLVLDSLIILASFSKRGVILILILVVAIVLLNVYYLFIKNDSISSLIKITRYYLITFFSIICIFFLFIKFASYNTKVEVLKSIGIDNVSSVKKSISNTIFRSLNRFHYKTSYDEINRYLWSVTFDPRDPDNGWGDGNYEIVCPLQYDTNKIVPTGYMGYLLNHDAIFGHSDHHAYTHAPIRRVNLVSRSTIIASIKCYVSNDFNGDQVSIQIDGNNNTEQKSYDLNSKGVWKNLEVSIMADTGKFVIAMYFNKQGVTDYSTLKGYVIFADPEIILHDLNTNTKKSITSEPFVLKPKNSFLKRSTIVSHELILGTFSLKDIFTVQDRHPSDSIFNIKKRISRFLNNDTTKTNAYPDHIHSNFESEFDESDLFMNRIVRWEYAFYLFNKEYNLRQKIFGGGFNFQNQYGLMFYNDKNQIDYPHNPILYVLLYSGLIGVFLYVVFLVKAITYYLRYLREYYLFFLFFLVAYYFTFFSGGHPCDPPIVGFFIILPFFINYLHKKDDTVNNEE
jgi:hypothetical protein